MRSPRNRENDSYVDRCLASPKYLKDLVKTGRINSVNADEHSKAAEEWLPTRQSLLSRLRSLDDQASWKEFFDTYWKLIYSTARKAGCNDAEAQDAVQETVLAVSKQMPSFQYDPQIGSFKGWLLRQANWRIQDQFRKRLPAKATEFDQPRTDLVSRVPDPAKELETIWDAEWNRHLLEAAVARVKRKAEDKQFQIFDLYVLHQWSVPRICAFLNVGRGQVYLAKFRISRLLKKELQTLQQKWS